jgi:ribosome-associated protein
MMAGVVQVSPGVGIPLAEITVEAVRAQGAGGQNINKVSNAVHLRFDIAASSLSDTLKRRLLASGDGRITTEGVLIIKAQEHRSRERNLAEAHERLAALVRSAMIVRRARRATRPTRSSVERRLEGKRQRSDVKRGRGRALTD